MAHAREAMEWSELSTHYFLDSAMRAARNSDLYLVALNCAARHPGASERLAALAQEAGAPADGHMNEITAASARFLGQLTQLAAGGGNPVPALRGDDIAGWLASLTNYMNQNGLRAPLLADDAASLRRVVQFGHAYFEFVGELTRIGSRAEEQNLRRLLASIESLGQPPHLLRLRGAVGASASVELLVQNTRAERAIISCRMPLLRSANGIGPAFTPEVVIQPNDFALDPTQEARVQISLRVTANSFAPATSYVGELQLRRGEEPEVRIPLRLETEGLRVTP